MTLNKLDKNFHLNKMYTNIIEDINEKKRIRLSDTLFHKIVTTEFKKNLDKGKNPIEFCNFIKGRRMIEFM